jgi:hypothetical protein
MFYLIPRPLLPGEKERKKNIISVLAPLPWERGWGGAYKERAWGERLDIKRIQVNAFKLISQTDIPFLQHM